MISAAADKVLEEVRAWQQRPLHRMYPTAILYALRVNIRDEGVVRNKAVYLALGLIAMGTATCSGSGSTKPKVLASGSAS